MAVGKNYVGDSSERHAGVDGGLRWPEGNLRVPRIKLDERIQRWKRGKKDLVKEVFSPKFSVFSY